MDVMLQRKTKVQSWYLDVTMLAKYWGAERVYHHTAPINMTYALYEALRVVLEEGLEACHARHLLNHRRSRPAWRRSASSTRPQKGINCRCSTPCGFPRASTTPRCAATAQPFGIEIGGGLGEFKGKVWRIGLMGYGSRPNNVFVLLSALEQLLAEQKHRFEHGSSIAAATAVYSAAK